MESWVGKQQTGRFAPAFLRLLLPDSLYRKEGDPGPPQDLRTKFYTGYHKEAEEHDKEFVKKHDEDLNTTLVFVSRVRHGGTFVLTAAAGWFVFRCGVCLHHRDQLRPQARSERGDRRPPPCPHLQSGQHHIQQRSRSPAVDRSRTNDCPGPGNPLRKSRCFTLLRVPRNAWQAMGESICIDRSTRVHH